MYVELHRERKMARLTGNNCVNLEHVSTLCNTVVYKSEASYRGGDCKL